MPATMVGRHADGGDVAGMIWLDQANNKANHSSGRGGRAIRNRFMSG